MPCVSRYSGTDKDHQSRLLWVGIVELGVDNTPFEVCLCIVEGVEGQFLYNAHVKAC
jgi:hypothetical protein